MFLLFFSSAFLDFRRKVRRFTGMKTADQNWERLVDLACLLHQQNDFHEILRVVAQQAASLLQAEIALILMINPRSLETVKTVMREGELQDERKFKAFHHQISGWIMSNRLPLLCENIKQDARFSGVTWREAAVEAVLGVPLSCEGTLLGTLILLNKTAEKKFTDLDLAYLERLAVMAAPYLRNVQKIAEYFETPLPEAALFAKYEQAGLLGKSPKFIELLKAIEAATRCDVRVLVEGETGTGKELVARAIHRFSRRSGQPFVAIDCGAIPENLIESELFGHVKGAFTGALQERKGLFEEAHQGTLFMDEIANLPLHIQTKFMRVLEQNEVRPLGSNVARQVDVRVIAASSRSLRELMSKQLFREDLFYRLHVYPLRAPSLQERLEDIPLLAHHFLQHCARQQQKQVESFHDSILLYMKQRSWPGNIRQLENFVERLVTLSRPESKTIKLEDLPVDIRAEVKKNDVDHAETAGFSSLTESLAVYEAQLIRQALSQHRGNQSQAARHLRIPVQTLQYKMKKLGIAPTSVRKK